MKNVLEHVSLLCADEFIERMPDKYNTYIEQGGLTYQVADRNSDYVLQKALLKKPKILILDDSIKCRRYSN